MMKVGFNPVSFKGNEQLLLNGASGQNIDKKRILSMMTKHY